MSSGLCDILPWPISIILSAALQQSWHHLSLAATGRNKMVWSISKSLTPRELPHVTCVEAPWQSFTLSTWPNLSLFELTLNSLSVNSPIFSVCQKLFSITSAWQQLGLMRGWMENFYKTLVSKMSREGFHMILEIGKAAHKWKALFIPRKDLKRPQSHAGWSWGSAQTTSKVQGQVVSCLLEDAPSSHTWLS
jgi:hypothetical protein